MRFLLGLRTLKERAFRVNYTAVGAGERKEHALVPAPTALTTNMSGFTLFVEANSLTFGSQLGEIGGGSQGIADRLFVDTFN
jgi:hypothetical protein